MVPVIAFPWLQKSRLRREPALFVRAFSLKGPTENSAAEHLRLRRRRWRDFRLRRRWRDRQIIALHRVDQFAIGRAADRRTIVDARGRALGRQFRLLPGG